MDRDDQVRGAQHGVLPFGHRGGSGVVLEAADVHLEAVDPDDALDHRDPAALPLEVPALLDVELEDGPDPSRVEDGALQRPGVEPVPLDPLVEAEPVFAQPVQLAVVDGPGRRPAAEEAVPEVGALLVAPDDHFQRVAGLDPLLAERPQHLERSQDAERAVVVAALRDGVEVGPEEDGGQGLLPLAPAEEVAGGIGAHPESGAFHLARDPGPGREFLLRESEPVGAAAGVRAEAGERDERVAEAPGVDFERGFAGVLRVGKLPVAV